MNTTINHKILNIMKHILFLVVAAGLFFSVTIVNAQFPNPAKVAEAD